MGSQSSMIIFTTKHNPTVFRVVPISYSFTLYLRYYNPLTTAGYGEILSPLIRDVNGFSWRPIIERCRASGPSILREEHDIS